MRRHLVIKSRDADEANFHRFEGTVYVVDLATVTGLTEEFEGREWLVNRTKSGLPFGWDVEWQPDRHTDHDNPVALMKFADDTTALLIRTHHTRNWLPQSVIKALKSERCAKVGVGYGDIDKEKIRGTFNFYPSNVRDLSVVARRKGLAEQGLKALCEHFGYKPEKSARCARSDWSTDQLTNAQIQYAADDAYFLFILDDLLEALPDVAVDDAKGPEDLVDRGILQIREGLLEEGIVRKHDGLYCTTCGLGPWMHPDSVIGHLQGKKHVKKMETSRGTGTEVALRLQSERAHTACRFRALSATGLSKLAKHSASQDIAHSLPPKQCDSLQLGPQQEKEKPPAAAAEEPAVAKRKNPGAKLRSSSSNEILEAGRMLLGQLQHFTPEELWEKQTRTRDVQMFVERLQKGSTKAAGIVDCPDAEAGMMLAGELLAASESVTARMEVLEHVRRKTTALLELDLPPAWQDEWSSFSRSLASSVLSYMANTAAAKLRPRDTSLSVSFLKFLHGGEVPGRITCGSGNKQIRATSHGTVQANGALSLVETLLANASVEDLKAGVVALEPHLPVTSSMKVYTDEYLYSHPFWMPAAMVAFSFAVIACDVLELEKSTLGAAARRREPLLTEAVEALVRRKQELPLRLRVFNLRGKAEHMGKQAWVAMLKWVAENQSMAAEDVKPGLEAVEAPAAAAAPESCEPPAKKSKVKYGAAALKFLKS